MLFRKKQLRSCNYCSHGTCLDGEHILCAKRGIVGVDNGCRKFVYDPYKRVPPRPKAPDFSKYKEEDFSL